MKYYDDHLREDLLRKWEESDCTVREFCRRHDIKETTFHTWKTRKRESQTEANTKDRSFVKVPTQFSTPKIASCYVIEIGACKVHVPTGFQISELKEILEVIGGGKYGL